MQLRSLRILVVTLWCGVVASAAAPAVDKVEPPSWWVGHTWDRVQVLLTGRELQGAEVSTNSAALRPTVERRSSDGRYLFVSLSIASTARPGQHTFQVKTPSGTSNFSFVLQPPLNPAAGFRGFTPDDVVYLIVPDRFADGDPANNHPPDSPRASDRRDPKWYHGGDFAGIRKKLGYLKDLGVTGIWLLPVYQNSRAGTTPGYFYGYEPADWYAAESRYGDIAEMTALVDEAHRLGMKVMQDQVANHCGPAHPWVQSPPTDTWFHDLQRLPRLVNNFDIASLTNPYARPRAREIPLRGWFAGNLPDFNQDDPFVRNYLIQNSLWWIGTTHVDGVRIDTYPYVDRAFWEQWQTAVHRQFPSLFVVGEITAPTPAALSFFEGGTRREGVDTKLASMLDFPLFQAMRNVFGRSEPLTQLSSMLAQDSVYRHPQNLVAFFDNHDNARLLSLAKGDVSRLMMAHTFLLSTARIPQLFYGDEIGMGADDDDRRRSTAADFPGGFAGDRTDSFTEAGRSGDARAVFDHLRDLLRFRRDHAALRSGRLIHLITEKDTFVYLRTDGSEHVLAVLRSGTGGEPVVQLELDDQKLPDGLTFRHWRGAVPDAIVKGGRVLLQSTGNSDLYWSSQ